MLQVNLSMGAALLAVEPCCRSTPAIYHNDHSAIYFYYSHFLNWDIPVVSLCYDKSCFYVTKSLIFNILIIKASGVTFIKIGVFCVFSAFLLHHIEYHKWFTKSICASASLTYLACSMYLCINLYQFGLLYIR